MTHDSSTCPRCRWAAAREGYGWSPKGYWWKFIDISAIRRIVSFCASLGAVAGLRKEMNEHCHKTHLEYYWNHSWWPQSKIWVCEAPGSGYRRFESPEDLPAACVIDAAIAVLGKEEGK